MVGLGGLTSGEMVGLGGLTIGAVGFAYGWINVTGATEDFGVGVGILGGEAGLAWVATAVCCVGGEDFDPANMMTPTIIAPTTKTNAPTPDLDSLFLGSGAGGASN